VKEKGHQELFFKKMQMFSMNEFKAM